MENRDFSKWFTYTVNISVVNEDGYDLTDYDLVCKKGRRICYKFRHNGYDNILHLQRGNYSLFIQHPDYERLKVSFGVDDEPLRMRLLLHMKKK